MTKCRTRECLVTKNSKHDDFILKYYNKPGWTVEKIAAHLRIPKGSVTTRYAILTGRRRAWSNGAYQPTPERPQPGLPKLRFLGEE